MLASIIIPCKNEGKNILMTLDSLIASSNKVEYEIIVVDDGSTDDCCIAISKEYPEVRLYRTDGLGAARARNYGAENAKGKVLIFCDAHLTFQEYWIDKLVNVLQKKYDAISPGIGVMENPKVAGFGLTWDNSLNTSWFIDKPKGVDEVPLLPGGCLAIKSNVFKDIGGFDKGFIVWGHEDEEISLKLWLFGYTCCIFPEVLVLHKFRSQHPYKVTFEHVHYNFLRMANSHFNKTRVEKVKGMLRDKHGYNDALTNLIKSDVGRQRDEYLNRRKYNDDWFFNKFKVNF